MKIHLLVLGGIRSHYIKIAAMQYMAKKVDTSLIDYFKITYANVGQHYSATLADNYISELKIDFQYQFRHSSKDLNLISGSIFSKTCALIDELDSSEKIDYVVVIGDALTTAIGSAAASIKRKKVIHIEAGERHLGGCGPEEANRLIADNLSSICFTVTHEDLENLHNENKVNNSCFSGDIVYDFVSRITRSQDSSFQYYKDNRIYNYNICDGGYILASLHHVENLDQDILRDCFNVIHEQSLRSIFIAHPRIKKLIKDNKKIKTYDSLIVDQIPYLQNLLAVKNAECILTDSGGMQKEAYYLDKRCIVRSSEIVWESLIHKGTNIKIGSSTDEFRRGFSWLSNNIGQSFPYGGEFGNGDAFERILKFIIKYSICNK